MGTGSTKKTHPWLKRLSYLIAGGTVVTTGATWFAQTPIMQKVYIRKIASVIKNKTGLDFGADTLNFSILRGQIYFERPYLGSDLLKAEEINITADIKSFFGNTPRIQKLVIISPTSNINNETIEQIKIMPSNGPVINWVLDKLEIHNGNVIVNDAKWGSLKASFNVNGLGYGTRKLQMGIEFPNITIASPKIIIDNEDGILQSTASSVINLDADILKLQGFDFNSELLKIQANGIYDIDNNVIQDSSINGSIYSQYLSKAFGIALSGQADFGASVQGEANNPHWVLQVNSSGITTPYQALENCSFVMEAQGGLSGVVINEFCFYSNKSSLSLHGTLKDAESRITLIGNALPFAPLTNIIRSPILQPINADISAILSSTALIKNLGDLSQLHMDLNADLKNNEGNAGNIIMSAENNLIQVKSFNINVPEITISAEGNIGFNTYFDEKQNSYFKLTSIKLNTIDDIVTKADKVADALDRWIDIDRLPIFADVRAKAELTWSPSQDLRLDAKLNFVDCVYNGTVADQLVTDVKIESKTLSLDNIYIINNDETQVSGSLWLTWDDVPVGGDQIYMQFESHALPLSDGLNTGISDNEVLNAMDAQGLVDASVTLHGPFDAIQLKAEAELYDGSIYGVSIPAFSCAVKMNLGEENLRLLVPEFHLADSMETLVSRDGSLSLKGNLDIDLTDETWNGNIFGLFDSHLLGITNNPQVVGYIEFDFNGPYASDFGSIKLPEGTLNLKNGKIIVEGNEISGLRSNVTLKNGQMAGTLGFSDKAPAVRLNLRNNIDSTGGYLNVSFLPDTADTKELASKLTNGVLENFELAMGVNVSLNANGLRWWANIDTLAGKIMGLDFCQQNQSSIQKTVPNEIQVGTLNLESFRSIVGGRELWSQFSMNGTIPLNNSQPADLTLRGSVDLEQAKNTLARVFNKHDDFLAGFTPIGLGQMDLKLQGAYPNMGMYGDFLIPNGELKPRGDFPYGIDKLDIHLKFDNRRIMVNHIKGILLRGGNLEAAGEATWNNNGIESYNLKTNLNDFQYNYKPDGFQFGGSLDALFHNNTSNRNGVIQGKLTINNMEYMAEIDLTKMIFNNTIGSIPTLQTINLNNPLDNINLDLDIDLQQPWVFNTNLLKFRSNNKSSEQIKILGTLANPGLRGGMEIVPGGRITNILPNDIIVENGSIDFPDPNVLNPIINIQGLVDITPFRINLNIQGPIDSLNFVPTSMPTLRQNEIVALLLNPAIAQTLGNSSFIGNSSVSATSTDSLAEAATGILSNLFLTSIFEQVRRTLGFDRVSVAARSGITGGSTVATDIIIGKNIEMMSTIIPLIGSYKISSDISTIGGQMELRYGNLLIHFGVDGSLALGISPSGEIRYSWNSR